MAGTQRGFNDAAFRDAIRFVFNMAAPPEEDQQLTFHFEESVTSTGVSDGDGVPFDPSAAVTRVTPPPVRRPCDIEYLNAADEPTPFGVVVPSKIRVTLLDEDYQDVKDATFVMMGGDVYLRHHVPPASGLFNVGLHVMVFVAENEV